MHKKVTQSICSYAYVPERQKYVNGAKLLKQNCRIERP